MKTISLFRWVLSLSLLAAVSASAFDIPFLWLEGPVRSNPNDPKSSLYVAWTPTSLPVATSTYTRTITATYSISPTFSASPTYTVTPSATPTRTNSPSPTESSTETPYAGTPTNTSTITPTSTVTPTHTPTSSITPSNTPSSVKFEDFELATPLNPVPYGNGPVPSSSWDNTQFVSGARSWGLVTSSTGWGAGINISSNYGIINATGALSLSFWMKSDQTANFTVRFSEDQAGVENENWRSADLSITGGSGWQLYTLDLTTFVEDDYGDGSCSGTCSSQGNGAMELGIVDKFEIQFAAGLAGAIIYLDDVTFNLTVAPTPTPTFTATPYAGSPTSTFTPTPYVALLFEDFEGGALNAPLDWGDTGTTRSQGISGADYYTGVQSNGMNFTTVGYGAGVNFGSNYYNGMGIVDMSGAVQMSVAIKADAAFNFNMRFKEGDGGAGENGGDLENWISPGLSYGAGDVGTWKIYTMTISLFSEDDYGDGSCQPTCSSTGNGVKDLQSVKRAEISVAASVTVNIWMDDVKFIIPAGTPTITPTFSLTPTVAPTFTPCVPSATFGNTSIGAFNPNNPGPAGYPDCTKFVLGVPGAAQSIAGYVGTVTGQMQFMIYSNGAGKPQTLLASTALFTPVANAWNTVAIPPTALAAGTYWLAWQAQAGGTGLYFNSLLNAAYFPFSTNAFGSPPATYGSGMADDFEYSIYVNYCP